jgi:hypothetical protein
MTTWRNYVLLALVLPAGGCSIPENQPLIFAQAHTLGISATTTGSSATPELTLGYRDLDVALVPVVAYGQLIKSDAVTKAGESNPDALSVLGQFNVNTAAGTAPNVGLGTFFATGGAARALATGFQVQLSGAPASKPPVPAPVPKT